MANDKINIMYVIGSLGNARAGTERNLLNIIEQLDRDRFLPYLVSLQDCDYLKRGALPCDTRCLHLYRMCTPLMFKRRRELAARLQELKIDIVQTFFVEAHLTGGGAARIAGVRANVSSRRNLGYAYTAKEKLLLRVANRYPTRWLANSRAVAAQISKLEGIARDRIDVIYNGVEIADFDSISSGFRETPEVDVIMVANLRPVKSVETLIHAAAEVLREHPRAQFAVLGDGPLRKRLADLCRELEVTDNVMLAGSCDDIRPWLANARIGVLTSLSEGCANAILEYMNASLPVVASAVGGNIELVVEGRTGMLFPPRSARSLAERLSYLLNHPDHAAELGRAGRTRVAEDFSLQRMMANYQNYCESLLTP